MKDPLVAGIAARSAYEAMALISECVPKHKSIAGKRLFHSAVNGCALDLVTICFSPPGTNNEMEIRRSIKSERELQDLYFKFPRLNKIIPFHLQLDAARKVKGLQHY